MGMMFFLEKKQQQLGPDVFERLLHARPLVAAQRSAGAVPAKAPWTRVGCTFGGEPRAQNPGK